MATAATEPKDVRELLPQDWQQSEAFFDSILSEGVQRKIESDDSAIQDLLAEARTIKSRGFGFTVISPSIRTLRTIEKVFDALSKEEDQGTDVVINAEVKLACRLLFVEETDGSLRPALPVEVEEAFDRATLTRVVYEALGITLDGDQKKMLVPRAG